MINLLVLLKGGLQNLYPSVAFYNPLRKTLRSFCPSYELYEN